MSNQILTLQEQLEILAKSTNKDTQTIEKDMNRPLYFDPSEAVKYGLIDKVRLRFQVCTEELIEVYRRCWRTDGLGIHPERAPSNTKPSLFAFNS